jgi:hypothetical protein
MKVSTENDNNFGYENIMILGWQYLNLFIWPSMWTRLEHAHCLETINNMWFLGKKETVNAWKKADIDGFRDIKSNQNYAAGRQYPFKEYQPFILIPYFNCNGQLYQILFLSFILTQNYCPDDNIQICSYGLLCEHVLSMRTV